jgi:integrase/recombinase XerD
VTRLIDAARNLSHRTLLMTLYSTAVRRSELCRLQVSDIDSQRMMIRIHGKGGRDRDVPLSPKLLETLRLYWRWRKPKTYLFPGTIRGRRADVPITANIVWLACRQAAQRAGISKRLSPHSLRHSCATHLLDAGADSAVPSWRIIFSVNSPVSMPNIAMLCCLACRSQPTIFISASFVPSLFG